MDGAIIGPKVTRRLDVHLISYFDFRDVGPCSNLRASISRFMEALCEKLDAELIQKSVEHTEKSFDDWTSWYVDEALRLQINAVGHFAHAIGDLEAFPVAAGTKVPCELGYRNFQEFAGCWRRACALRQAELNVTPKSKKFQDKRADHDWAPYFSDLFKKAS
ncbi:hypothetical protein EPK99_09890 [Neorhizobium lilium]|uniref:Uncharacterized protein n=1 Tax=Neorhizobium lilium TaxID=2503024 RepID=A0A444LIM3_9HYPH|nr:hypothetical protein [Neorhizobium lilium]RWX78878.1 hypothetical protein EPK99_09890 [Neorhizobium lilium]